MTRFLSSATATKTCFKCATEKPVFDFYRHPAMADGFLGKCKECTKRDARQSRILRIDQAREYDRSRSRGASRRAYSCAREKNYRKANPEKYRAKTALNNAIRDGRISKPDACEICGKRERIHGHHFDYSLPLLVIWLCAECHGQIQ